MAKKKKRPEEEEDEDGNEAEDDGDESEDEDEDRKPSRAKAAENMMRRAFRGALEDFSKGRQKGKQPPSRDKKGVFDFLGDFFGLEDDE